MGKIYKALEKSGKDVVEKLNQDAGISRAMDEGVQAKSKSEQPKNGIKQSASLERLHSDLVSALLPNSMGAEQFRNLKNNLLFPEKGTPPRTIMVTSTSPGDGKSFVASNLAISIAQSIDEYVLLMDCDLRVPSIHTLFGLKKAKGLSEYLSAEEPLSNLLVNTFLDKLKILPAGRIPDNPSELLSSEQMRRLIHEVKLRYADRYIVLDTPPPYITSETSALARQVDGIVLVVRQRKSKKQDIHDVIDIYGREKILGIVYNDAESLLPMSYGSGKYGYGYGYGKYHYGAEDSGKNKGAES